MNAVEIEEAVSKLVEEPFNAAEFSYAFLEAFGNKTATLQRLRSIGKNSTNKTDVAGDEIHAVLQRNNIHIATCSAGGTDAVASLLKRLVDSPASSKHKAKFALATDGHTVHAECLNSEEPPLVCEFKELADHFGYFLELAGISTVRQIRENAFDIKATGRLNRLYVELLRNNPDWDGDECREELNHFFARLIFCFFAEDTGIFNGNALFTETVRRMSDPSGENTDFVLAEVFRAMDVPTKARDAVKLRPWAGQFPYVNGGLFGSNGSTSERGTVPKFTQIARSYLLHIGSLDWTQINPDIFGSMIQAVADDEERGALGMHYTSVPNILKVLNPLFLDDLHAQLKEADKNPRKLLNLRKRLARIRVFDPACGSGNFLVIAYKEMRKIEAEINILRGEPDRASEIPLTNFRGIELRHFAVEIARLALIIAEYQCDELYRGQRLALAEFLPLNKENWITHGNALRLDWLKVCPPTGTGGVKLVEEDLFQTPLDQTEIDFENEGGETYICGNPPYKGNARKTADQKEDLKLLFSGRIDNWGLLDYVCGWFFKAYEYAKHSDCRFAFVATNSVVQGQHVSNFWYPLFQESLKFFFAVRSFKWSNLAANDAGVTVVILGATFELNRPAVIYDEDARLSVENINAYLLAQPDYWVVSTPRPVSGLKPMVKGNYYGLSSHLLFSLTQKQKYASLGLPQLNVRRFFGSAEVTGAKPRFCFWFKDKPTDPVLGIADVKSRLEEGILERRKSNDAIKNGMVNRPHQFREMNSCEEKFIAIPVVSSENREFLPAELFDVNAVISNKCFGLYDAPQWYFSLIVSRLHWTWIATVCVRLELRLSYSNMLGWNTFPVPALSDTDKSNLASCAENILLAREAHWPATIAELYDSETMPEDLRAAHDRNDETLERIYIGRRFKNDTERLETLFQLYTEMTAKEKGKK